MGDVVINGLVEGGKATSGAPFGPALGPLGVNIASIVNEINEKTKAFDGIKVPVKVVVNSETKHFSVSVGSPPTSALIMKELGIQKGAKAKEEVVGNITMEQLRKVVNAKEPSLYGNTVEDKIKQVAGTCKSMNITVEGSDAMEFIKRIDAKEVKV
ncbi:MAG: 50S ribosomal protein L11 [Candidatus Micrarchaeota archaeon]|nr:50S ribosomal protein L11 [Candidatus Micrarchaeota archaeon]